MGESTFWHHGKAIESCFDQTKAELEAQGKELIHCSWDDYTIEKGVALDKLVEKNIADGYGNIMVRHRPEDLIKNHETKSVEDVIYINKDQDLLVSIQISPYGGLSITIYGCEQ